MATEARFTQGRVRVNKYGAGEMRVALDAHLGFLLDARLEVLDLPDAKARFNARIEHTRRVIEELDRVIDEHGWSQGGQHGQLQQRNA